MKKLTFEQIDKRFHGQLSLIIQIAREEARQHNFDWGYERYKEHVSYYVGWDALHDIDELRTSEAYKIVCDKLADECWAGHDEKLEAAEKKTDNWIVDAKTLVSRSLTPEGQFKESKTEAAYSKIIKRGIK